MTSVSTQAFRRKGKEKRGRPPLFSIEQIAEALKASGGVRAGAARYLSAKYKRPCERKLVSWWVERSPELQTLLEHIDDVRLDYYEDKLHSNIEAGSERALHFFLSTRGRKRGYVRGTEITGIDQGPIRVLQQNVKPDEYEPIARKVLSEI